MPPPFLVCRDGDPIPPALRRCVVAIGNFDGIHRAHQDLIAATRLEAARLGCAAAALTFEPHPRAFFNPDVPLFRLTPEAEKLTLLALNGLDGAIVRRFDAALAGLSAEEFFERLLVGEIKASGVVIGHDFHFGRGREGTPARLEELCKRHGLTCAVLPVVARDGEVVSSSAIRRALEEGAVAKANALLGYRWFVRSQVRHGDKRGRVLGFPTANLRLPEDCRLRHGIYAVRARASDPKVDSTFGSHPMLTLGNSASLSAENRDHFSARCAIEGGAVHEGVASFGRRPTFDNGAALLEVHLFDFAGDLYDRTLTVEFVGWIRGEERFASAEALVERMNQDAREARALLSTDRVRSVVG
jgi:riboflavin kinase/FMN adenylyltransferase